MRGRAALAAHQPGGIELERVTADEFEAVLKRRNHTLETRADRSALDQRHRQRLFRRNFAPSAAVARDVDEPVDVRGMRRACSLRRARCSTSGWRGCARKRAARFPTKVTAFHDEMAVHGRYGLPCPVCGTKVQRIRYADNETNYCPRCQTERRSCSPTVRCRGLLKKDWPKSIDELEQLQQREPRATVVSRSSCMPTWTRSTRPSSNSTIPLLARAAVCSSGSDSARSVVLTASYEAALVGRWQRNADAASAAACAPRRLSCRRALLAIRRSPSSSWTRSAPSAARRAIEPSTRRFST